MSLLEGQYGRRSGQCSREAEPRCQGRHALFRHILTGSEKAKTILLLWDLKSLKK